MTKATMIKRKATGRKSYRSARKSRNPSISSVSNILESRNFNHRYCVEFWISWSSPKHCQCRRSLYQPNGAEQLYAVNKNHSCSPTHHNPQNGPHFGNHCTGHYVSRHSTDEIEDWLNRSIFDLYLYMSWAANPSRKTRWSDSLFVKISMKLVTN